MRNRLLLIMLYSSSFIFGQTGINTQNPQAIFHVDGNKDNPATIPPSKTQQSNDFVVNSNGQVGVGTANPTQKLEIINETNGALKIVDGTQADGKVFTSDTNGIGSWKVAAPVSTITGICPSSVMRYGVDNDVYMGAYIDLPQGEWFVYLGFLVNGASGANKLYASRLSFSTSSSTSIMTGAGAEFINGNGAVLKQVSNGPTAHSAFGMFCSGIIRIAVTRASPIRLYLWDINSRGFTGSKVIRAATGTTPAIKLKNILDMFLNNNAENYLFAIKSN